jgi:hypothetical protein
MDISRREGIQDPTEQQARKEGQCLGDKAHTLGRESWELFIF